MTLPNLRPGWNHFKVAAQAIAKGSGLKVILEWSDKDGSQRVEQTTARLPFEFDVFANCSGGAAVQMRSLQLKAIPLREAAGASEKVSAADRLRSRSVSGRIGAIINAGLKKDTTILSLLILALKDDDPEIRYWAADALGKIGDSRAIPALIGALRDPLNAVRMSACVALGELKAKDALPDLLDLVSGKTPSGKGYRLFIPEDVGAVRWMAARALGRIADLRAVEPLSQILRGRDSGPPGGDLGLYLAQALGELGDRRAIPALLEVVGRKDEPELRGVVEALGRIGDAQAVPVLIDLLQKGKEDVRYAAAVALGHLGDPRAVAALSKAGHTDPVDFVREAASAALARLPKAEKKKSID